jgi:hypothetical protein
MKVQEFLAHHGIAKNPFSEEDAQTDPVFKGHCIQNTYHPAWDKIFGDPLEPATSIVFGEKGAGKTAMRLQIARHLEQFNREHPKQRLFVIHYDDFNSFLDRFVNHLPLRRRRVDKALAQWRLWDHMDAILSLGVSDLDDRLLGVGKEANGTASDITLDQISRLDASQRRDLLLLAACYDHSTAQPLASRWKALRRKIRFRSWKAHIPFAIGCLTTLLVLTGAIWLFFAASREGAGQSVLDVWQKTRAWVYGGVILIGWAPWLWKFFSRMATAMVITRSNRVSNRTANEIRQVLMNLTNAELKGQPLPARDRTDDRYESLSKFQGILKTLGFGGVFILIDRVDEPHLINGSPDLMRALIWPLLDNKFLKNQGIGVKMMLPAELRYYVEREGRDFAQRARLDKQNLVPSLAWTGEALFDVANARLQACALNGKAPNIVDLFDSSITRERLIDSFRLLRVPRHLHKFLYHLFVAHCNAHTDELPAWKVTRELFETELAMYRRDMESQAA